MKQTRFFRIFSLAACFLLAATTLFAQPGGNRDFPIMGNRDGFPDLSYLVSPARGARCDLAKQICAMPEFKAFADALTAKIDAEYDKVSGQWNFPTQLADYFLDKVRDAKGRNDISSKDVIELFYSEIELLHLEVFAKKAYEAGASVAKDKVPFEIGKNATLTVVTKFSPAELSGILDHIPPFVSLEMFKAVESDFLVGFSIPDPNLAGVKLFVGGQKLEGRNDYAVVVSLNRELVERKLDMMQNERFRQFFLGENAAVKSLRIGKNVFDVIIAEVKKKIDAGTANPGDKDFVRILEQVNSFSIVTRDIDGKTNTIIRLALNNVETAENLLEAAVGGKAMLRFLAGSQSIDAEAKKLIDFVLNTEIVRDGTTLTATINWSNSEFLQMLKDGFKKGVVELKK